MKWRQRVVWTICVLSFAGTVALIDHAMRPRPERASPQELYQVVQQHLLLCRAADFPQAYHAAASRVQEQYSLVQFATEMRRAYQPMAGTHHVEYGEVHRWLNDPKKATVDVFFVGRGGEAVAWNYVLVYEDGDWKVDHGEPLAGWQPGRRRGGLQI